MKQRQKRFQFWTRIGIQWTKWFEYNGPEEPIQLKGFGGNHLLNEYRTIEV